MLCSICCWRRRSCRREVPVAVVDRLELAAVDGHDGLREQLRVSRHSTTKRRQTLRMPLPLSRRKSAMVLKSGARRPVNHISSTIALALALQAAAGLDAVEVAVDVDLQQHRRVVRRAARGAGVAPSKPKTPGRVHRRRHRRPDRVVLGDEVIQALGKQRDLAPSWPSMNRGILTPVLDMPPNSNNARRHGEGGFHTASVDSGRSTPPNQLLLSRAPGVPVHLAFPARSAPARHEVRKPLTLLDFSPAFGNSDHRGSE